MIKSATNPSTRTGTILLGVASSVLTDHAPALKHLGSLRTDLRA
jgi:hypothetical protein